jgi:hypothetical protein
MAVPVLSGKRTEQATRTMIATENTPSFKYRSSFQKIHELLDVSRPRALLCLEEPHDGLKPWTHNPKS